MRTRSKMRDMTKTVYVLRTSISGEIQKKIKKNILKSGQYKNTRERSYFFVYFFKNNVKLYLKVCTPFVKNVRVCACKTLKNILSSTELKKGGIF